MSVILTGIVFLVLLLPVIRIVAAAWYSKKSETLKSDKKQ